MNNERLSDKIFKSCNRIYQAKISGALNQDEFSDTIISISTVYANQVKMGIHNEDDEIETYLANIPKDSKGYFSFPHFGLNEAYKASFETITMAQLDREKRFSVAKVMKP